MRHPLVGSLTLLYACSQPAPDDLPVAQAPPPALVLEGPEYFLLGTQARLEVFGAPPGATVRLLGSPRSTGAAACPAPLAPTCLDLPAPVRLLDAQPASSFGHATLRMTLPPVAPSTGGAFQAVVQHNGAVLLSQVLLPVWLDPTLDADLDGLSNGVELSLGTDPRVNDTDGDGLGDGAERAQGTDPLTPDTDGDTLSDAEEPPLGTDPLDWDTDDDLLADGVELLLGTDPLHPDTDSDGVPDGEELWVHGTDPLQQDLPALRMFITLTTTSAAFGGVAEGDRFCGEEAARYRLGGQWHAWLSSNDRDARDVMVVDASWYTLDGTLLARSNSDLLDGQLRDIIRDPIGVTRSAWTGSNADGTLATGTCADWRTAATGSATAGASTSTTTWSTSTTFSACGGSLGLYCMESPPSTDDNDHDGLLDDDEALYGALPWSDDSDGDGLSDAEELDLGTDPSLADFDGDTFSDGDEQRFGTDPLTDDAAPRPLRLFRTSEVFRGDFAVGSDAHVIARRLCASSAQAAGLDGAWEAWLASASDAPRNRFPLDRPLELVDGRPFATSISAALAGGSLAVITYADGTTPAAPGDHWTGASNTGSTTFSTHCQSWQSTSGSGMVGRSTASLLNAWSTADTTRACSSSASLLCFETHIDPRADHDRDGLTAAREALLGTNPELKDSDGDGAPDGAELLAGSDPTDPVDTASTPAARVFLTSTAYPGDFGGAAAADLACQTHADRASLTGTWGAWLGADGQRPIDRVGAPPTGWATLAGLPWADDDRHLLRLTNPADLTDERGVIASSNTRYWSGTNLRGDASAASCAQWTSRSPNDTGVIGAPLSDAVLAISAGVRGCHLPQRLLCVELSPLLLDDPDRDGLPDSEETTLGTSPELFDTDGDGLIDGDELLAGADPLAVDTDGDGLRDGAEVHAYRTDPTLPDTDGDGASDGAEIPAGTDPLVP